MPQPEIFVHERLSVVDGFATSAIVLGEITALSQNIANDSMKKRVFVRKSVAGDLTDAILPRAQFREVSDRDRYCFSKKSHNNPPLILFADLDIKENFACYGVYSIISNPVLIPINNFLPAAHDENGDNYHEDNESY